MEVLLIGLITIALIGGFFLIAPWRPGESRREESRRDE